MRLCKLLSFYFLFLSFNSFAQMQIVFQYRPGTMTGNQPGPWTKFENPAIQSFWINGQKGYVLSAEQTTSVREIINQAVTYGNFNVTVKQQVEKALEYFSSDNSQREVLKDYVPSEIRPLPLPKDVDIQRVNTALEPMWNSVTEDKLQESPEALEKVEERFKDLSAADRNYARSELNRLFTYPSGQLKNLPYLATGPVNLNSSSYSKTRPFIRALNEVQVREASFRKDLYQATAIGAKLRLEKVKNESEKVIRALKIEEFKSHYFDHSSEFPAEVISSIERDEEILSKAEGVLRDNPRLDRNIPQTELSADDKLLRQTAELASCIDRGINCGGTQPVSGASKEIVKLYQKVSNLYQSRVRSEEIPDSSIKRLSQNLVSHGLDKIQTDANDSDFYVDLAVSVTDIGLGFIPGVGTAKDFVEFVSGKSLLTGESLDKTTRAILATSVVIDLASFGTGGRLSKIALESAESSLETFAHSKFAGQVGKHWNEVSDFSREVLDRVKFYEFESPVVAKAYSRLHEAIETIAPKFKIQDVKEGISPDKVAIIGRKMENAVNDVAAGFNKVGVKVETFNWTSFARDEWNELAKGYPGGRIPYDKVVDTIAFEENKEWAERILKEGYTVFDIGDPLGANIAEGFSAFYDIENIIIWGKPRWDL